MLDAGSPGHLGFPQITQIDAEFLRFVDLHYLRHLRA
jgi:hypothetical protein